VALDTIPKSVVLTRRRTPVMQPAANFFTKVVAGDGLLILSTIQMRKDKTGEVKVVPVLN
jgi:hypothetical protein